MGILRQSFVLLLALSAVLVLGSCGEQSSSSNASAPPAQLTPEQEQVATDTERGLRTLRQDSETLMEDMQQNAEPEIQRLRENLETSLAEAQRVVGTLRVDDGRTWEEKVADVDQAIRELSRVFAEASVRMKSGGVNLPGIGD